MTSDVHAIAANLTAAMKCFARARPEASVTEEDGLTLIDVGPEMGLFNSALLTRPVSGAEGLAAKASRAAAYFGNRPGGWGFWVCNGLLDSPALRRMRPVFESHGMNTSAVTPGLLARDLRPPSRALPKVAVRPVAGLADRQSFCHIMSLAFEGSRQQVSSVYGAASFWGGEFQGWLGSADGSDVCAGATVVDGAAIGIYAVATLPPLMRRGYAETLIRDIVARELARHGPLPLVLQSTASALRLYRRLGFETITSFSVLTS